MEKKVVLITGASSGIGKETAKLLVENGHIVYGAARRLDKMNDLKEATIKLLEMDVTNDESMVKGIQKIIEMEKRIEVLVNNEADDIIFGLARLTQLVLPHMRKQQSGKIVNISSMGGKFGEPHGAWYHATKFAVEGLSDSLRMELKQFKIDVVIIEPGAIKSEWGGIAKENLLKVSGNTAYKNLATKHATLIDETYKRVGSEPIVIAKTITKAINSNNPKTRYAVGGGAKLLLFMRRILSDKLFDKIFLSQLK